jgi:hypothetical protein
MKKNTEALRILQAAKVALPVADSPCAVAQIPDWIEMIPFAQLIQADSACRAFAKGQAWPPMTNDVLAQVHLRIDLAIDRLRALPPNAPSLPEVDDFLRMLLIDLWHVDGPTWGLNKYRLPAS